ncbi:MAG TPA: SIS domain-containing protein [Ktedonobacteraceae bacterium]|nr:SIS domain-containing protein [Ktedonobacteraceae bacterium]
MQSLLEQEIFSQPDVIAHLLTQETQHVQNIVAQLPPFEYIVIAARGSSDHAATYAKYAWPAFAGYPVALATPSLHTMYHQPPQFRGALVVGISQSGQSPDIVSVLEEGKRQGRPTLAITNDASSPLAKIADHVVELHTGLERSVAATKTYSAQLVVMMLFAAAWSADRTHLTELQRVPEALARTLQTSATIAGYAEHFKDLQQSIVIGRGYNYATSFELALKLKELTYMQVIGYSSADFRHGPIATVAPEMPVILIMPGGATYDDMLALANEVRTLGAELLVISDKEQALALASYPMPLEASLPEWLSPVTAIIPGQLFALHLALAKGFQPDVPRGLNKVTLTH